MKKYAGISLLLVAMAVTALWAATASQPFTITIAPAPLVITSGAPPNGQVGVAYSFQVTASGGVTPYVFSATGLPLGLNIDPAAGLISGTPTAACSCVGAITVTDAQGNMVSKPLAK